MSNIYFWNDEKKQNEISGVSFDGITNDWTSEFTTGLRTNSEEDIKIMSYCGIVQDSFDLANNLKIRVSIEENGTPIFLSSTYTFREWANNGISLGTFNNKTDKVVTLMFSCHKLPKSKNGQSGHFDFEFGILE